MLRPFVEWTVVLCGACGVELEARTECQFRLTLTEESVVQILIA